MNPPEEALTEAVVPHDHERPLVDEFAKAAQDSVYRQESDGDADRLRPASAAQRGERGPEKGRDGKDFERER